MGTLGGGGQRGADRALAQLAAVREEEKGGGAVLAWPTTAASTHSTDHNGNLYFRLDTYFSE